MSAAAYTTGLGLVVTAGGYGLRLGADGPKQYVPLLGIPMVQRTIAALDACAAVTALVVVVNPEDVDYCAAEIVGERFDKVVAVVAGGRERALSVRNGLARLAEEPGVRYAGVHDGARPLVMCADVDRLVARLDADPTLEGALLGLPSADTVKLVDDDGRIAETPSRRRVWRAQTPQIFRWEAVRAAYGQPDDVLLAATDDSSLVERLGGRVAVVEGSPENLKITDGLDLRMAELLLAERRR
jgi:2-C-methyl-D-erythritol 4-phosphate cytidylyltransferase